ncbi:MAG: type II toxin-antitoxin system VapC family toxin [Phycisphaerae bacterium]|nr:type II toxin-antitoxin system VapC family toxin [Phycisphaerae bacterium]
MSEVFADTAFFVAFLNSRDDHHTLASRYMSKMPGRIWTTDSVLTELGNCLARSAQRVVFVPFVRDLLQDPRMQVVRATTELFDAGLELYHDRPDKTWSLTDCISFVVMDQQGLTDALTVDRHFEQAGFSLVLK